MLRTPGPALRRAVGVVKLVTASTLAVMAVGHSLGPTQGVAAEQQDGPTASDVSARAALDAAMTRHDCSPTGFGPDVIPGSALIERDDRVQRVSFDDGWAVYTGDATGSLLAVCRSTL